VTADTVALPHISNMELREFKLAMPAVRTRIQQCRVQLDHLAPYEAFRNAEEGDAINAGIEIVMIRGTASVSKKRNSAHLGSSVESMPKLGRFI